MADEEQRCLPQSSCDSNAVPQPTQPETGSDVNTLEPPTTQSSEQQKVEVAKIPSSSETAGENDLADTGEVFTNNEMGSTVSLATSRERLSSADGGSTGNINILDCTQQKAKIDVLLKATGNAPIMKKKKWAVEPERSVGCLIGFIRRYLKLKPSESLFLYVNQAFAPSPDQTVRNVYDCFGTDGKLVLHYCKSQAWG